MIFVKSSSRFNLQNLAVITAALLLYPACANAQDSGYAPPPMFEDVTAPMVRPEAKDGYIVAPRQSSNPDVPKTPAAPVLPKAPLKAQAVEPPKMMKPIIEEKYIQREKPAVVTPALKKTSTPVVSTPVPPQKPKSPVSSVVKIEVPIAPVKEKAIPESKGANSGNTVKKPAVSSEERTTPIKRDPTVSAIQGPKTMPALPTQSVDQQILPGKQPAAPDTGETILERHQKALRAEKEAIKPIIPMPKVGVAPASFDRAEKSALKKTIPYEVGQIGLPADIADPIASGVSKELEDKAKNAWRVQIKSFATPHGTGLSSDRRIALSRALSLRSTLITQGIPASRIDVLAEGLDARDGQAGDRIDLYIYPPEAPKEE